MKVIPSRKYRIIDFYITKGKFFFYLQISALNTLFCALFTQLISCFSKPCGKERGSLRNHRRMIRFFHKISKHCFSIGLSI